MAMNKLMRVKTGVIGLDEMLGGGLIKGSSVLLAGHSGTGKTLLGLHFIKEGLLLKENCVYVSLVKDPSDVIKYYGILNIEWGKHIESNKLKLLHFKASEIDKLISGLKAVFRQNKPDRIVIDGLPYILKTNYLNKVATLLNLLKRFDSTSVFISAISRQHKETVLDNPSVPELFNSVLFLEQKEKDNELIKSAAILKAEGTVFDTKIREIRMGRYGLLIKNFASGAAGSSPDRTAPGVQSKNNKKLNLGEIEKYLISTFKEHVPEAIINIFEKGPKIDLAEKTEVLKSFTGILTLTYSDLHRMAGDDLLISLDDYVEKEKYFKGCIEACTFNGKVYGVPEDAFCRCLIYRKDLLNKYNLQVPKTWKQLVKTAQEIMKKENNPDLTGLVFYNRSNWMAEIFLELLWGNGGDIFDEKGSIIIANKVAAETLKFMQDLIYKHKIVPASLRSRLFYAGKAVFLLAPPYAYKEIIEDNLPPDIKKLSSPEFKNKIYIAPLPQMKNSSHNYRILSGVAHCITKNTKDIKASAAFLKFITSEKTMKEMELTSGWPFPALVKLWKDKEILLQKPYYGQAESILEKYKIPSLSIKNYKTVRPVIQKEILKALGKTKTIQDVVNSLESEIKTISKRHKDYERITKKITDYLRQNYDKQINLEDVAKQVKLNSHYMEKIFKIQSGSTIFNYLIDIRINKAVQLLKDGNNNVSEVSYKVGYNDVSYFSKLFKRKTKYPPSEYRLK